ncbi:fructosamine kinase family protein [Anditalea andensis]|uniref:Ketosamine-3-kinase n=1 Tax=Anditalea andensis TaxID=1048983 RepID=A0A074L1H7_9BACT|nr:fructosamine kinase family protein [Anditalea andensis]KEO73698.1 ketosamine-3-kinase [Anditalea andensis]
MFDQQDKYHKILLEVLGNPVTIHEVKLVAAGNLNQAIFLSTGGGDFFLKTNYSEHPDIFEKEALALEFLKPKTSLHIPSVYGFGKLDDLNYLITEWIPNSRKTPDFWKDLGYGLAQLHMVSAKNFGMDHDNYISHLPQINTPKKKWSEFFISFRLEPMLTKAFYDGLITKAFMERFRGIYDKLPSIFPNEIPSLLHGDLWSGNVMGSGSGGPALIDPAIYFGQREVDLAFSKLFGGFESGFYDAYHDVFPLEPGFDDRVRLYNLYPLLVHLNLFGQSYLSPIEKTVRLLL